MRSGVVYLIRIAGDRRVYVGSTIRQRWRFASHRHMLRHGRHHCEILQRAYDLRGEASLSIEIVERVDDQVFLKAREQFWIWRMEDRLMNLAMDAWSPRGIKRTDAFCKRQAERMHGNTLRRGQEMPSGFSERVSERMRGNKHRLGKPHSADVRARIAASLRAAYAEGRR